MLAVEDEDGDSKSQAFILINALYMFLKILIEFVMDLVIDRI